MASTTNENGRALVLPVPKPRTREQQARYELVKRRSEALQAMTIKPPASGTFGHGAPDAPRRRGGGKARRG